MVDPLRRRCRFLWQWPADLAGQVAGERLRPRRLWSVGLCTAMLAQVAESPWSRLPPPQRAKVLGSLILLTIGGVSLVVLAWLTLRIGRRRLRREDEIVQQLRDKSHVDDWANKPLAKRGEIGQDSD